ncbi:hypothetical protein AMTR_s00014p00233750 [Amborella trichopoda]|uniref:Uncharacterized protein n=1 Tax=Amborella trichopoda TaxID=13333 RepID=W1PN21_AMBTC|nr:hypothetical protein AMTR_s00014p00233750 [Amborella trichopoda]
MVERVHASTLASSAPRRMSLDSDPCPWESASSELGEASEAVSEAADEGLITVPREELRVSEVSEPHEATAGSEVLSSIGEEEPVLIEQPEVVVLDNKDRNIGNEGLNAS